MIQAPIVLQRLRKALWSKGGGLFIPLAALLACLPWMLRGVSCGHDFDFHLVSWLEVRHAWSEHLFYPHWAESPNWSTGEPRFVFYPPLSWMAGASLGMLFGWKWAAGIYIWLSLTLTGFTTRALARAFLPGNTATLAGVIAAAAPYALFVAYERTAFSELAAAAWIPLLLLFALRREPAQPSFWKPTLQGAWRIALVIAILWLTNAPSGVIGSYLLVFAALSAALLQRSWLPAVRALIGAPLGLGIAAIYLVPAAWEQRWIAVDQALDVGMRVYDSWLFAHHAGADMKLHDEILQLVSLILTATATAAALAFFVTLRAKKLESQHRTLWLPLAAMVVLVVLLQFPLSWPLWLLPKMQFLQFPWRWLIVLDVPFAIFLAAATPLESRKRWLSLGAWATILLALSGMAGRYFFQPCDDEDDIPNQTATFTSGSGVEGTDEYAPAGADNSLVTDSLPDACLVTDPTRELGTKPPAGYSPEWYPELGTCDQTFQATLWQSEHKIVPIDADHEGYLVLRLRRYPAWQITIDDEAASSLQTRDDGLIVLPVDGGPSKIEIRWTITPDQKLGRRISAASSLLLLILLAAAEAKRKKAIHLSS